MSLDLTTEEVDEIWMEAQQHRPPVTSIDRLETIYTVPPPLGSGHEREIELYPWLTDTSSRHTLLSGAESLFQGNRTINSRASEIEGSLLCSLRFG